MAPRPMIAKSHPTSRQKSSAILQASAEAVLAPIDRGREELRKEITVCAMDLYTVETTDLRTPGGADEIVAQLLYFIGAQLARTDLRILGRPYRLVEHAPGGTDASVKELNSGDGMSSLDSSREPDPPLAWLAHVSVSANPPAARIVNQRYSSSERRPSE
jgi:hypothetical protein